MVPTVRNDQASTYFYLLVTPSGSRVELRYVGGNIYESKDSTYLQLIDYGSSLLVRPTDGTQLNFVSVNGYWRCNQVKDRNGNYQSVTYNSSADIANVTDTLGRVVTFNYDGYGNLVSITQAGRAQPWATFGWGSAYVGYNFSGLTISGPVGTDISVITQVGLPDGSHYNFDYNTYGMVSATHYYAADNHQRRYTTYTTPANSGDCPRLTDRRDWQENWNGDYDDIPATGEEAVTSFTHDGDGACRMTAPDGTVYKEYYGSSWASGLSTQSEVWSGGVRQKWTTAAWTQDNTTVSYLTNPRVIETNIWDASYNRRRMTIGYQTFTLPDGASCSLPNDVAEYAADASTVMRRLQTYIETSTTYTDRRIIGLPWLQTVSDGAGNLVSKQAFSYDWNGGYLVDQGATVQHDGTNYGPDFLGGRGNLVVVRQFDITDPNNGSLTHDTRVGYNTNGSVVFQGDASWHTTSVSYGDSFSDGINRNTFAYPTTVTDADSFSSTAQYDFYLGAMTRTQGPPPTGQSQGAIQTMLYDSIGRIERVTTQNNGAYTRWDYAPYGYVSQFDTIQEGQGERYTTTVWDGGGRVRAQGGSNPGSSGGYWGKFTVYDVMGRANQQTNPAEINGGWAPVGDDAAGWIVNWQTYDWKGRPYDTTNPDGTIKHARYTGCGCAGGEVVTLTDEAGRSRRITSDVIGRQTKTEELNWDGSVYSTANFGYNALDELTSINYEGQVRALVYDGYGRLQSRTTPEQGTTTYSYFADDSMQTVTDARGATSTFSYDGRHLITSISYGVPAGVAATSNVSFAYDGAGNRTLMTDGLGSVSYAYDQLSRMTSETRTFNGLGSYLLSYGYNLAGELTSITNPWNAQVGYSYDSSGRMTGISGANYGGVTNYANSLAYRAFGGVKAANYGDGHSLSAVYDNRMRATMWNVSGVLGYNYNYDYFNEHTERVTYGQSIYDSTLDRSYQYDQTGSLTTAHSGAEARAHIGQGSWGTSDGPYSHVYAYDKFGNMAQRTGWGGEVQGGSPTQPTDLHYYYTNNKRNDFTYDASGNVTHDLDKTYAYDATRQQTSAIWGHYYSLQRYDGDGLRVHKDENETFTWYLRSSVLGGQVVAEMNQYGSWQRGYVYAGDNLIAIQGGGVKWVHQDPITKSKRITDGSGNVVSTIELDPWGADTNRSSNAAFQPRRFGNYERDDNGGQDAMARRYSVSGTFSQPDPYEGSYDFGSPRSFNRYVFAENDPVNRTDRNGLVSIPGFCSAEFSFSECGGWGGMFGGYFGNDYAEYRREYGGMSAHAVEDLYLHEQRVTNAMGGYGFLTSAQVLQQSGGRATDGQAILCLNGVCWDAGSVVWSERHYFGGNPFFGGTDQWPPPSRNPQPTQEAQPNPADVQRRIDEGKAWDKWQEWVNCNTPIMNKYNAQLTDYHKFGGTAFQLEVAAGYVTFYALASKGPVMGGVASFLGAVGVNTKEREDINAIISNYQSEVGASCGQRPPHP